MADGSEIFFIRREGWGNSRHGLYLWNPTSCRVRTILSTDDVIRMCYPRTRDVICLAEGSIAPRRVVRIDYDTGTIATVFDPNQQLQRHAFLAARRQVEDHVRRQRGDARNGGQRQTVAEPPEETPLEV